VRVNYYVYDGHQRVKHNSPLTDATTSLLVRHVAKREVVEEVDVVVCRLDFDDSEQRQVDIPHIPSSQYRSEQSIQQ
jgi:hypothetical protein